MASLKRQDAAVGRCAGCGGWGFAGDICTACGGEVRGKRGAPDADAVRECCLTMPDEAHGSRGHPCILR